MSPISGIRNAIRTIPLGMIFQGKMTTLSFSYNKKPVNVIAATREIRNALRQSHSGRLF